MNPNAIASEALRAAHRIADDRHAAVRRFRNTLIIASLLTSGLVIGIVILGMTHPGLVPLCGSDACPSGGRRPSGGDVGMVCLFGSIGASIAVISTLSTIRTPSAAYSINGPQLFLKVPAGAVIALAVLVGLDAGVIPSVGPVKSQGLLLFYSVIFGYAQQVATRLIDHKADAIQDAASAKPPS